MECNMEPPWAPPPILRMRDAPPPRFRLRSFLERNRQQAVDFHAKVERQPEQSSDADAGQTLEVNSDVKAEQVQQNPQGELLLQAPEEVEIVAQTGPAQAEADAERSSAGLPSVELGEAENEAELEDGELLEEGELEEGEMMSEGDRNVDPETPCTGESQRPSACPDGLDEYSSQGVSPLLLASLMPQPAAAPAEQGSFLEWYERFKNGEAPESQPVETTTQPTTTKNKKRKARRANNSRKKLNTGQGDLQPQSTNKQQVQVQRPRSEVIFKKDVSQNSRIPFTPSLQTANTRAQQSNLTRPVSQQKKPRSKEQASSEQKTGQGPVVTDVKRQTDDKQANVDTQVVTETPMKSMAELMEEERKKMLSDNPFLEEGDEIGAEIIDPLLLQDRVMQALKAQEALAKQAELAVPEEDMEQEEDMRRMRKRTLTAERKKKKKANDRKNRAEKERKLGIRRRRPIVFTPIEKPPVICKFYLKGRCTKGDNCTFSHEATPETKSELCKFFLSRCCMKGDDCPFSHDTSSFPCKYMVIKGHCSNQECSFSHRPVTPEEYEKVLQRVKKQTQDTAEADDCASAAAAAPEVEVPEYEPDFNPGAGSWWKHNAEAAAVEEMEYDPFPAGSWWKVASAAAAAEAEGAAGAEAAAAAAAEADEVRFPDYSNADEFF